MNYSALNSVSSPRIRGLLGLLCCLAAAVVSEPSFGQDTNKKKEIPKPENVTLEAPDGFTVFATYYPGGFIQRTEKEIITKPGTEVVPVILVHGYEGNRREFEPLALTLQRMGHAVLAIDLRGHGDSNKIRLRNGAEETIEASKLRSEHFRLMEADVEAAKKFLLDKNNSGEVNLELLCLVGSELGGIVATNWIAADWSRRDLPAFKQGKYAKALVIISPNSTEKGYNATVAWKHFIYQSPGFSIMLIAGKRDNKSMNEAKQIFNRLEKSHPLPTDEKERMEKQTLFLIDPDTELAGTKLLDPRARVPVVAAAIAQFIALRLVNKSSEYPWAERKNPLSGN